MVEYPVNPFGSSNWRRLSVVVFGYPGDQRIIPGQANSPQVHQDFDLLVGIRGHCTIGMLGHALEMRDGRMILVPPGVSFRVLARPDNKQSCYYCFSHFDCAVDGQIVEDASDYVDPSELSLTLPDLPTLSLVGEADSPELSKKLCSFQDKPHDDLAHLTLTVMLKDAIRHLRATRLGLADPMAGDRLDRAMVFMGRNLSRPLSREDVAEHVDVSAETLGRLFRTYYHVSPMLYLTRLRMARARDLLGLDHRSISDVARECGYSSIQYFSRAFRKAFDMSPSDYRKQVSRTP